MTSKELIHLFARTVAYGGGLIINVGPAADGKIPLLQQERIEALGSWLKINEEAIYGATKWEKSGEDKPVELQRIDSEVNFNWVRNSPGYPITEDSFTAQWSGFIRPDATHEYTFYGNIDGDDGIQLTIGDKLLFSKWDGKETGTFSEAMRENSGTNLKGKIRLEGGKLYPIKIEYSEKQMGAKAIISWETASLPEEVVPQKNLFSTSSEKDGDGLKVVYQSMRQHIAYTKNNGNLYAISFEWPRDKLVLHVPNPPTTSEISLLGREGLLPWTYKNGELIIDLSAIEYNEIPSHEAWTFKITEMK